MCGISIITSWPAAEIERDDILLRLANEISFVFLVNFILQQSLVETSISNEVSAMKNFQDFFSNLNFKNS